MSFHKFWNPMVRALPLPVHVQPVQRSHQPTCARGQVDTTFVNLNDFVTIELLSGRVHGNLARMVEWWKHRYGLATSESQFGLRRASCDGCWWHCCSFRNDRRVKFFFYKDMVENHRQLVEDMAEFMEIPDVDEELIDTVVRQSSHKYMSSEEHKDKCVPCVCTVTACSPSVRVCGCVSPRRGVKLLCPRHLCPSHHHTPLLLDCWLAGFRFADHMVVKRLRESRHLPPMSAGQSLTGKVRKTGGKAGKGRALLTQDHRVRG